MKILVIPDVHARRFWREAVDKYADECDKIIFIGDYVDPYQPEGYTRTDAIRTLEDVIEYKRNNRDKVILLIGNHDAHYFLKGFPRSTRYDSSHAYKLREIYSTNKDLFRLAYEEIINGRKYLFTHAGVMNSWLERNKKIIGAGRWSTKAARYPRGIATHHKTISSPAAENTVSPPALHTPTIQSIQKELKG